MRNLLAAAIIIAAITPASAEKIHISCRFDKYGYPTGIDTMPAAGTDKHTVEIDWDNTTQKATVIRKGSTDQFDVFAGDDRQPDGTIKHADVNWITMGVIDGYSAASVMIAVSKNSDVGLMNIFTAGNPAQEQLNGAYRGICTKSGAVR